MISTMRTSTIAWIAAGAGFCSAADLSAQQGPRLGQARHHFGAPRRKSDTKAGIRTGGDSDACGHKQASELGRGCDSRAMPPPARVLAGKTLEFPGHALSECSAQAAHRQAASGLRRMKSSAISSNVTHLAPACEEMWSMIRSSISRTCGRPDTSGWIAIVNAA